MSDRTPSSVRTGSPAGDAAGSTAPAEPTPVSATQTIPGASTSRSKGAATGATPAQPAGGSAGAPPVPPTTGSTPAAQPAGSSAAAPPVPPTTRSTPAATSAPSAAGAPAAGSSVAGASAVPGADTSAPEKGSRIRGQGKSGGRGPRRARLQLRHIDTWSALKISLVLSIALFFIWMVAVGVLYGVLSALGVFDTLNELFGQLGSASGSDSGGGGDVVTPGVVFGGAAVIGAINIVLLTALCTVGTFIYNLCSDLVGGLELTLSERD
jgi:hypothetical protein